MTISNLPPIPSRNEDPENFREKADNFVAGLPTFIAETNAFAGAVNADGASVAASRASAASSQTVANTQRIAASNSANFKGPWLGKTGAVAPPYAVLHNDRMWVLMAPISNIAASEPSEANADWSEFKIYNDIRKPFPLAPLDGATGVLPTLTLEASEYAPSVSIDARLYRRFELSLASDPTFTSPIFTAEVDADTVAVTPSLDLEASYVWRCKDVSARSESLWMDTQGFTVTGAFVVAPTLTVEGAPDEVPESPTLTGSAFTTVPEGADTHLNTDWQVLEGATVVYESLADSVNLTSIVVPAGNLDSNTEYTFRVRYRGNTLGVSAYTEVVATTLETFDIVPLLAVAYTTSPFITIYNQEIDTFTKLANPAVLPPSNGNGVAFSSDDTYMAVAHRNSPFITIYKRDVEVFTKLADPATLPASVGLSVAFSSDDTYMAVAFGGTSTFIHIYKRSGDTFTKLANPSTLPTGVGESVAFSSDDTYMAVGHRNSPFITIYKRSGDTFTKLADPSILPTGTGEGVAFSSDNTYLAVAHEVSPFITIYKRSGDTFTKLANPATLPANNSYGVAFSSDDTYMAVGHVSSPFITIYKRSGDTFTKLADPAILPTGSGFGVAFSSDDTYMAVTHATSPFVTIYKRSGDTFTKLADPSTLPTGTGNGVAFSNTGFPQ
jgi:6-phosphogluconolactonase (cycloisomerase 2 family)